MDTSRLSFGMLAPLDQRAIGGAWRGEEWAQERLREFTSEQRFLAGVILRTYFGSDFEQVTGSGPC